VSVDVGTSRVGERVVVAVVMVVCLAAGEATGRSVTGGRAGSSGGFPAIPGSEHDNIARTSIGPNNRTDLLYGVFMGRLTLFRIYG